MSFAKSNAVTLQAEEDLYLAADGVTVVHAGDYRAATLLARAGHDIPPKLVERLKLDEGTKVETLQKEGPKEEELVKAKDEYDKKVSEASVAHRKKDLKAAIAAYESASEIKNLAPTLRADALAQVKALKTEAGLDTGKTLSKHGTVSNEDVESRSTRPETVPHKR